MKSKKHVLKIKTTCSFLAYPCDKCISSRFPCISVCPSSRVYPPFHLQRSKKEGSFILSKNYFILLNFPFSPWITNRLKMSRISGIFGLFCGLIAFSSKSNFVGMSSDLLQKVRRIFIKVHVVTHFDKTPRGHHDYHVFLLHNSPRGR